MMQKISTNFMQQVASDDIFVFAVGFKSYKHGTLHLQIYFYIYANARTILVTCYFYNIKASLLSAAPAVALTWPLGEDELRTAELR